MTNALSFIDFPDHFIDKAKKKKKSQLILESKPAACRRNPVDWVPPIYYPSITDWLEGEDTKPNSQMAVYQSS